MTAPAPLSTALVDGLAVTRRRPADTGDAPTVVLVHGAMDRAASFGRTMRRLGHLDVVAYDRRGYAGSLDAGTAPDLEAHAQDLLAVLRWTNAEATVVVGHSLGGTIGAMAALAGAPGLSGLAAYESPFPVLDDSFDEIGGGALELGDREGAAAGAEHFYRLMVGDHTWSRLRPRDQAARRAEGPALMAELRSLRDRSRAVDPSSLGLPVLVGSGGLSSERMQSGARLLLAAVADGREDRIELAGHGAHLTHPDEFARYCTDAVALAAAARTGRD